MIAISFKLFIDFEQMSKYYNNHSLQNLLMKFETLKIKHLLLTAHTMK